MPCGVWALLKALSVVLVRAGVWSTGGVKYRANPNDGTTRMFAATTLAVWPQPVQRLGRGLWCVLMYVRSLLCHYICSTCQGACLSACLMAVNCCLLFARPHMRLSAQGRVCNNDGLHVRSLIPLSTPQVLHLLNRRHRAKTTC